MVTSIERPRSADDGLGRALEVRGRRGGVDRRGAKSGIDSGRQRRVGRARRTVDRLWNDPRVLISRHLESPECTMLAATAGRCDRSSRASSDVGEVARKLPWRDYLSNEIREEPASDCALAPPDETPSCVRTGHPRLSCLGPKDNCRRPRYVRCIGSSRATKAHAEQDAMTMQYTLMSHGKVLGRTGTALPPDDLPAGASVWHLVPTAAFDCRRADHRRADGASRSRARG